MIYIDIVNQILEGLLPESKRSDAKGWANTAAARLWEADEWNFKVGSDTCGIASGAREITSQPADLQMPIQLFDQDGGWLNPFNVYEFFDRYSDQSVGTPEAWTMLGGDVIVAPVPNISSNDYTLIYKKSLLPMVLDGDVPGLPEAVHGAIIDGGKAIGAMRNHIPTWRDMQNAFDLTIAQMKGVYLQTVPTVGRQQTAFRP